MDSEWNGFAFDLDLHDGHDASPPASLATTTAAAKAVLPDKKRQRVKGTTTPVTDKRLNDVHGQLIEANERIHVLEALVKQQLLWLEEEREAHGQTWREAKEATDQFHRERTVHDRQTDFTPLLEQQEADLDELRGQLAQADIMHQMTNARVQEAEARIAALETELQAERASNFDLAHQVAAGEQKFNEKQAEAASLVYALEASRRAAARTDEHMLEVCKELEEVKGNVTSLEGELATAKKEAFDACVEVSRLGEAAADSLTTERAMTAAVLAVVRIAARLGDPQAEGKALTDQIDYAAWRRGATAMMETAELNAVVVQGAATVIGTLIPILYGLYMDAGVKNEKLITNYDALATHAKALEADLAGCKCPEMRAYIAQIEKEMTEAESLIHKQNGTNQDLHIRVQRRSAVESFRVDVDGQGMFKDLVMVRDQKKQLQDQVQRLERDLASARTATANLQKEKGQIAARLLEAEKQIPPPRALLFVGDLEDNVEQLRRSLGPLGDSTPCNQCTIYLGKAREAERKRSIAEQSVVEEQRRLVKMTEDNKLFVEAKIKDLEREAAEAQVKDRKDLNKAKKRLAELEAKLKEHDAVVAAKDKEASEQKTIAERRLAAKNDQIAKLEPEAARSGVAEQALGVMRSLMRSHRFGSCARAERVNAAFHDAVQAVHAQQTTLQIRNAYQRLEGELQEFGQWLRSDEAKIESRTEQMNIMRNFAKAIDQRGPVKDFADAKDALATLHSAWVYAYRAVATLG